MRKLDIGSVRTGAVAADFETVDCMPGADHRAQWGLEPLPFGRCAFDEVYASHTLEHVPWLKTDEALAEIYRILKPGGLFEVWVPDFEYIVRCYLAGCCGDAWRKFNPQDDYMRWLNGRTFTYGPGEENWHRAVFDRRSLGGHLRAAGFNPVRHQPKRLRGTSHGKIDLGFRARKPKPIATAPKMARAPRKRERPPTLDEYPARKANT